MDATERKNLSLILRSPSQQSQIINQRLRGITPLAIRIECPGPLPLAQKFTALSLDQ